MRQCRVDLVPMDHPGDVSAVAGLFDRGLDPASVVAILGKTEGNGCVNDFTRGYAVTVLKGLFADRLACSPEEAGNRVSMIMSGGTKATTVSDASGISANQATEAWPKFKTMSAAIRGPSAWPRLPPTWNSDWASPWRPPDAMRATRADSG